MPYNSPTAPADRYRDVIRALPQLLLAAALFCAPARGEVPQSYTDLWRDPAIADRIRDGIEKHRKGDASIRVLDEKDRPVPGATVRVGHQKHDFLFGCNLFVLGQLATAELNRKYEEAFARLFNCATLPFYWRELEPTEGAHRFDKDSPDIWRRPPPDRLVRWCKARGIMPKGHALLYVKTKFMPDWTIRGDAEAFRTQCGRHMAEIAARYSRDIPIWDAINEELPRARHPDQWHVVPKDFLPWCFREAGRLFPENTKLLINDGTEQAHVTTAGYEAIIAPLLSQGLRVGGIGIQFHAGNRTGMLKGQYLPPAQLFATYDRLGKLGPPLYITEITIPGTGDDGAELQAAIVKNLYRLWFSTPSMAGVTWWNLGDGTAYENENKSLGGLLDGDMNPKPAYRALDHLINDEWKTRLALTTGQDGTATFRGFLGQYDISVESGGRTASATLHLGGGHPAELLLELPRATAR